MLRLDENILKRREGKTDHKPAREDLLTLSILVQNRRKDKTPVKVYPELTQVVSLPSCTAGMREAMVSTDKISTIAIQGYIPSS